MSLTREQIKRRYGSHSINPYDFTTKKINEENKQEEPFEEYGIKAYDIADELHLPLLYE